MTWSSSLHMQVHPCKSIIINICSVFSHWTVLVLCGPLILLNSSRASAAESGEFLRDSESILETFSHLFQGPGRRLHRSRVNVFQNFISFSLDTTSRRFHLELYINNIYNCVFAIDSDKNKIMLRMKWECVDCWNRKSLRMELTLL